jgi:hypothetical protein
MKIQAIGSYRTPNISYAHHQSRAGGHSRHDTNCIPATRSSIREQAPGSPCSHIWRPRRYSERSLDELAFPQRELAHVAHAGQVTMILHE